MFMPLEVEEKTFSKQMRGYNKEEVDTFVKGVAKDYATLYKENLALKDKTATLSDAVKQYKAMEDTLQQAIIVAQSAGEEVKKNAYAKAENIIKDAENRASEIVNEAGKEVKIYYNPENPEEIHGDAKGFGLYLMILGPVLFAAAGMMSLRGAA